MTMTKLTILYVCLIAALIVPAHSLKAEKNLIPVVLQLDWVPNAQFAGIYQAVKQGFYAEAGMEVEIRPLPDGQSSIEIVLRWGRGVSALSRLSFLRNQFAAVRQATCLSQGPKWLAFFKRGRLRYAAKNAS